MNSSTKSTTTTRHQISHTMQRDDDTTAAQWLDLDAISVAAVWCLSTTLMLMMSWSNLEVTDIETNIPLHVDVESDLAFVSSQPWTPWRRMDTLAPPWNSFQQLQVVVVAEFDYQIGASLINMIPKSPSVADSCLSQYQVYLQPMKNHIWNEISSTLKTALLPLGQWQTGFTMVGWSTTL